MTRVIGYRRFGGYASLPHRLGVAGKRVGTLVPTPAIALHRARYSLA